MRHALFGLAPTIVASLLKDERCMTKNVERFMLERRVIDAHMSFQDMARRIVAEIRLRHQNLRFQTAGTCESKPETQAVVSDG